jgi:putative MFS transporter
MITGGLLWGVLGDRLGRLLALFGSIGLYSFATLLVTFACHSLISFKILTLLASIGLAGELTGSITLILEVIPTGERALGSMIVAAFGMMGNLLSSFLVEFFAWRMNYFIGGCLGLALLIFRFSVRESLLYAHAAAQKNLSRGNWFRLFWPWSRLRRYLACLFLGIPALYSLFLINFGPELAQQLHIHGEIKLNRVNLACFTGLAVGDILFSLLVQKLKSWRLVLMMMITFSLAWQSSYPLLRGLDAVWFYAAIFILGITLGIMPVLVPLITEQFGTDLRNTASSTAVNFSRSVIILFSYLPLAFQQRWALYPSELLVVMLCSVVAFLCVASLKETFGRNLDFIESP